MNNTTILWEDTALIEPWKKSESKPIFAPNDGINEISNVSVKRECENTGDKKKWIRGCPKCHKDIFYMTEYGFNRAVIKNRPCMSCITTFNNRTRKNFIGVKFGGLTIINQYYPSHGALRVDYKCDCGNVTLGKLFSKVSMQKMCSKCRKTNSHRIKPNTSFNMLFEDYKRKAEKRNLEFQLSKDLFGKLTTGKCYYCGDEPKSVIRPNATGGKYVYNGVDRKNNSQGYTVENCVSCCKYCNFAKYDFSENDFFNHILKIYTHCKLENRR